MSHSSTEQPLPLLDDYDQFSKLFLAREDCLILVTQLNQLIKAVQRHRGISMGMLAGNNDFQNEFVSLQRQLERRLATLEAFASNNCLLSDKDKENLSLAWATIRSDWENDNLNDNFELHSHFIEQLLVMSATLVKSLELPLTFPVVKESDSKGAEDVFSPARMQLQVEILNFVSKDLPQLIEQVARIRGAAAYGAAVGSLDDLDERKIRFWVTTLKEQCEPVRKRAEKLCVEAQGVMSKLSLMSTNELHLLQFLNVVEATVFNGGSNRQEAHRLFNLASDVIQVYWDVIADGLDVIQFWHREDLEAWVALS